MKTLQQAGAIILILAALSPAAAFASQQRLDLRDPLFRFYRLKVARRVRHNWQPPVTGAENYPIVWFVLGPNGKTSAVRVETSSKDKALDQQAISAISASAPFSEFPPSFKTAPGIGFLFRFSKDFTLNRFDRTVAAFITDSKLADETEIQIVSAQWRAEKHREIDDFVKERRSTLWRRRPKSRPCILTVVPD